MEACTERRQMTVKRYLLELLADEEHQQIRALESGGYDTRTDYEQDLELLRKARLFVEAIPDKPKTSGPRKRRNRAQCKKSCQT